MSNAHEKTGRGDKLVCRTLILAVPQSESAKGEAASGWNKKGNKTTEHLGSVHSIAWRIGRSTHVNGLNRVWIPGTGSLQMRTHTRISFP